ncbi:hypothetical protein BJ742DRAFT_739951 [Cladochytrium replicatum]|nr:hypothetical protein BJ742DRAFT_739951 [Cladochytrium replicatum]
MLLEEDPGGDGENHSGQLSELEDDDEAIGSVPNKSDPTIANVVTAELYSSPSSLDSGSVIFTQKWTFFQCVNEDCRAVSLSTVSKSKSSSLACERENKDKALNAQHQWKIVGRVIDQHLEAARLAAANVAAVNAARNPGQQQAAAKAIAQQQLRSQHEELLVGVNEAALLAALGRPGNARPAAPLQPPPAPCGLEAQLRLNGNALNPAAQPVRQARPAAQVPPPPAAAPCASRAAPTLAVHNLHVNNNPLAAAARADVNAAAHEDAPAAGEVNELFGKPTRRGQALLAATARANRAQGNGNSLSPNLRTHNRTTHSGTATGPALQTPRKKHDVFSK